MNCAETLERLDDYADAELSPEERRLVELHLAGCASCRAELDRLNTLFSKSAALSRVIEPPADLWPEIRRGMVPRAPEVRGNVLRGRFPVRRARVFAIAAVLVALAGLAGLASYRARGTHSAWMTSTLAGVPSIGAQPLRLETPLREGTMIVTDASSRAKITNPKIGTLDLGPESRLTFVAGSPDEQRFSLERGTISASTWVPPRVFVVETPVASAVDLGCEYRLTVGAGGRSLLLVTAGWVELGWNGRSVIVPAAAYCLMRAGPGPGTPFSEYASDTLRQALEQFDFGGGATGALETILAHAGKRDAITLWHLISRVSGQDRPRVSDRLDALVPRPPGVTPEGVLRLDPAMLDRWWDAFEPVPVSTLRERPSPWSAFWSALERLVGT